MTARTETVLVAGAGIAGLGVALALGGGDREITILDRDPPPPESSPDEAFLSWERRGATQLRHSHVFLGRLTTLLRERYPDLLDELLRENVYPFPFRDALSPPLMAKYVPSDGDEDMTILFSRRTTLELVMRRYAARLPGVRFVTDIAVRGLLSHRDAQGALVADGLVVERDGVREELRADIVVDASGRNTAFPEWLRTEGCEIDEEEAPCGILYYTRHYKLRDGREPPPRDGTPGGGDMGYIKFGVFGADNRSFSITLALPEIETELRKVIMKPEVFDFICAQIPGCGRWTDPARAEPVGPVYAMGNLKSVWRHFVKDGTPQALNFFAIGDARMRTNPLYGRGCSAGAVHAHILRETLDAAADPAERARLVEDKANETLRAFYDVMVKQDLQAIRRAEHERNPDYRPGLRARVAKSFADDAIAPCTRGDLVVQRRLSRAFHMIDHPTAWLKNPRIMARIFAMWATPKSIKRARGFYPPTFGPDRDAMIALLGLTA
jgi:2-polyprenyl-6-methoxyphenol hydroxylase-like FAD-dependent oxidoreductase